MIPGTVGAPPPGAGWSPVEPWAFAWRVVSKRFTTVALPIAVAVFAQGLLSQIVGTGGGIVIGVLGQQGVIEQSVQSILSIVASSVGGIVSLLVSAFMMGGLATTALKAARGQPTSFGDPFSGGRYFGQMFVAELAVFVCVFLGALLCLVPGIIVGLGTCLYALALVDRNLAGIEAAKQSWEMTKGHRMNIFVFALIGLGVFFAGVLACGIGALLVSMPMGYVGLAAVYLRIKGEPVTEPT